MTNIRDIFISLFGSKPILSEAPGRINLIGEHTDYNNGFVLPGAINKKARFAIGLNKEAVFRFYAADLDKHYQTKTIDRAPIEFSWANYLLGVLAQFQKAGKSFTGIDCVFDSNIPIGAGLSSSAAIECGFAKGLDRLLLSDIQPLQLVKMAQKAEHEYAGVMCGIMDQYASVFGKNNHVLLIDCRTNKHTYVPFQMNNLSIALCDTKVKHELASSEYNIRRQECEQGVSILQQLNPDIKSLRDVDTKYLEMHKGLFRPSIYDRCHYVAIENQRVQDACRNLENSDFTEFGKLMYQSHDGLKNRYEVSCKELDILVDLTKPMESVYGSRMMGGGFGGCTINLLEKEAEEQFHQTITDGYKSQTGMEPDIYFVELTDGANVIPDEP